MGEVTTAYAGARPAVPSPVLSTYAGGGILFFVVVCDIVVADVTHAPTLRLFAIVIIVIRQREIGFSSSVPIT